MGASDLELEMLERSYLKELRRFIKMNYELEEVKTMNPQNMPIISSVQTFYIFKDEIFMQTDIHKRINNKIERNVKRIKPEDCFVEIENVYSQELIKKFKI